MKGATGCKQCKQLNPTYLEGKAKVRSTSRFNFDCRCTHSWFSRAFKDYYISELLISVVSPHKVI